jgi:hypothetical protein
MPANPNANNNPATTADNNNQVNTTTTTMTAEAAEVLRLQSEVQLLRDQLQTQQRQVAMDTVGSILPKPSTYDGTTDVDEWLFKVFQYIRELPSSESSRVRIAGSFLTGKAAIWWRQASESNVDPATFPYRTWESFKAKMQGLFRPINNHIRAGICTRIPDDLLRNPKHHGGRNERPFRTRSQTQNWRIGKHKR